MKTFSRYERIVGKPLKNTIAQRNIPLAVARLPENRAVPNAFEFAPRFVRAVHSHAPLYHT